MALYTLLGLAMELRGGDFAFQSFAPFLFSQKKDTRASKRGKVSYGWHGKSVNTKNKIFHMRYFRLPALRPKGPAIKRLFKFIPDKFVKMTTIKAIKGVRPL